MAGGTSLSAKYKVYPEYKNSGVEWLGEVPIDWDIKKLKYICKVQTGTRNTENAIEEGVYPFFVRSQTVERINSFGADCEAVLTAGDGVGVGRVFHYIEGKFDYHQRVYMLNNFGAVLGRFVYYYLSNNFYKVALEGNAKSTVDSLRLPQFLNFEFSLPKIEVQNTIINFLDHETAKIDTLIDKQQQLITLLKEKRQAVISHAVTKGLNPEAPMRDSGVEWLGEVPAHWTVSKVGFSSESLDQLRVPIEAGIRGDRQGEFPYYGASGVIDHVDDYLFDESLVLVCEDGWNLMLRSQAVARNVEGKFWVNNHAHILRPTSVEPFLLAECIEQTPLHLYVSGMRQPKLTADALKNIPIAYPIEQEERLQLIHYIKKTINKYTVLDNKAQESINFLQERRTALISAAVTGKIDVRNWVTPVASNNNKEVNP